MQVMHQAARTALGLVGAMAVVACYFAVVRPWCLRWGATDDEARQQMPGDDLIRGADSVATRGITIHAPIHKVWPWLAQLGQGRGGFYSYDWLENLAGCDIHSLDEVRTELQSIAVGDTIRLARATERYPDSYMVVEQVEPNRTLVLRSPNLGAGQPQPREFAATWLFLLEPQRDGTTRLITRARYTGPKLGLLVLEILQTVMEIGTLRGVRDRAERL